MEVILLQDVDKVGLRGEVVSVARGYMRNYLAPRRLAEEATPARVAELEKRDSQRARHEAASFDQAHDEMRAITDPADAWELHINLIAHGRAVCRPQPRCGECALLRMCPYGRNTAAVPKRSRRK